MKVREIISLAVWSDGSGWSTYNDVWNDEIIEIGSKIPNKIDFDFWETPEDASFNDETDLQITVELYPCDADFEDGKPEPLAKFQTWESDLIAMRKAIRDGLTM